MFSARTPHARLIASTLVLVSALVIASPAFARHRHHSEDHSSSKTNSGSGTGHTDSGKHSTTRHSNASNHAAPAKPAAAAPPASAPSVKTVPAPTPAQVSPLDMTRDGAATPTPGVRVSDAGRLNPAAQIARMTGALIVVLLLILGGAHLFRRSPLMAQVTGKTVAPSDLSFQGTLKAAFSFLSPLAALQPLKRAGSQPRAVPQPATIVAEPVPPAPSAPLTVSASLDSGLLRLSGAQALPGSAASIYLVQVGAKNILLGASARGLIQVLSEFEVSEAALAAPQAALTADDAPAVMAARLPEMDAEAESAFEALLREQDEEAAFDALLREQTPSVPERGETVIVQSVVERLNRTRERLSRRLSDGTAHGHDQDWLSA